MPPLELRLPHMMMRVDESRRHNLAGTINDLGLVGGGIDAGCNAGDLVALDEERVVSEGHDRFIPSWTWD